MSLLSIIIGYISYALFILFIARMIFSFARISPYDSTWGPIMRFVYQITEPILEPIRRVIPPSGGLDFSPMIVLFILAILQRFLR
ncbi:MAG: YggT family protein [Ardenticatenaceae bacterium]|nr:YggT family protein [Ardenticatenaceae bacterium]